MLQAGGREVVSKCDATPRRLGLVRGTGPLENITLDDARAFALPVLLVRGANSRILTPEAAERSGCAAAGNIGDGRRLRPQRARAEHQGVHRGHRWFPGGPGVGVAHSPVIARAVTLLAPLRFSQ